MHLVNTDRIEWTPRRSPSGKFARHGRKVSEALGRQRSGIVRHESGRTPIQPGDAFLFKPGEAHQILNDGDGDLIYYVIADNPVGESYHDPDSGKWGVQSPRREYLRGEPVDYFDGEDRDEV